MIERVGGRERISVDVRVIAATNKNLKLAAERGEFREDLYYRLKVVPIAVPPLRERQADLPLLANSFLRKYSQEYKKSPLRGFSREGEAAIASYHWPGNVRELENKIRGAVVMAEGPYLGPEQLDLAAAPGALPEHSAHTKETNLRKLKERVEREAVQKTLEETSWNISRTAKKLGISRPTLYELIEKYSLKDAGPGKPA